MIGLYRPGTSLVHRASPAVKLLLLTAGAFALVLLRTPLAVAVAILVVVGTYRVAELPVTALLDQIRPLRWVVVPLVPFQW